MQRLFFLTFFRIFKLVIYKCKKRKQKTHLYKYNSFVGVGKHVMNDSENSPTLKTKNKKQKKTHAVFCGLCFLC